MIIPEHWPPRIKMINVKDVYRGIFVQQNTFNVVMFYKYAYRYAYKKILSCKNKQTTLTR